MVELVLLPPAMVPRTTVAISGAALIKPKPLVDFQHVRSSVEAGLFLWITLRSARGGQSDAKVFKRYSQMKLQVKREALAKLNRKANEPEAGPSFDTVPKS